jgi:hypothetical protein
VLGAAIAEGYGKRAALFAPVALAVVTFILAFFKVIPNTPSIPNAEQLALPFDRENSHNPGFSWFLSSIEL